MDWRYNYELEKWELIDDFRVVATLKKEDFDYYAYTVWNIKRSEFFNSLSCAKEYVAELYGRELDE